MRNELETLLAAAAVITETRAVTARSMPANARAWPGEQELWMLCFIMSARTPHDDKILCSRNTDLANGLSF